MTIKQTLFSLAFVLTALVLFLAGQVFLAAFDKYNKNLKAEYARPAVENLLVAAGNWAVERGVTNSALSFSRKAPQNMLDTIAKRREAADEAYFSALDYLAKLDFEQKEKYLDDVRAAYDAIVEMRANVDKSLKKSKIARSGKVMKGWVPRMTDLILVSQELRFSTANVLSAIDQRLASQVQIQHFSWVMSEYAGRERAIVGGLLSSRSFIREDQLQKLSLFRGMLKMLGIL